MCKFRLSGSGDDFQLQIVFLSFPLYLSPKGAIGMRALKIQQRRRCRAACTFIPSFLQRFDTLHRNAPEKGNRLFRVRLNTCRPARFAPGRQFYLVWLILLTRPNCENCEKFHKVQCMSPSMPTRVDRLTRSTGTTPEPLTSLPTRW